jgi:hypothetical protein
MILGRAHHWHHKLNRLAAEGCIKRISRPRHKGAKCICIIDRRTDFEFVAEGLDRDWAGGAGELKRRIIQPWTPEEDERLRKLAAEGRTAVTISERLKRAPKSIRHRARSSISCWLRCRVKRRDADTNIKHEGVAQTGSFEV